MQVRVYILPWRRGAGTAVLSDAEVDDGPKASEDTEVNEKDDEIAVRRRSDSYVSHCRCIAGVILSGRVVAPAPLNTATDKRFLANCNSYTYLAS